MNEFHFLRPDWLLAFLPLVMLLWWAWRRKYHSRTWRAVCDPRLLPFLLIDSGGRQTKWPLLLSGVLAALVITALAGPTWEKLPQPVFREQSALVIVLDLSRSMDAADLEPSRLARARHKIIDILRRRKEGQTALLVYSANAYPVSPLTEDSHTIIDMVKTLSTDLMPVQGSNPAKAIQRATELLKQAGVIHGHILLITDGITPSQAKTAATYATSAGHTLSVLGVGTAEGAPIPTADGGFLKDTSGAIVVPKLNTGALRQLAAEGGGRYHSLTADDRDLDYLLGGITPQRLNAQRKQTTLLADRWREQGPWLLLLVLPFAALAFRRGYLAVLLVIGLPVVLPRPAQAMEWNQLWQRPDQQAAKVLRRESKPADVPSADVFKDPQWKAAAYYRAGQYQQAVKALQGIDTADALYNKGNALAKLGKLPEAIQAYDAALKKDPQHADAKYNREQVEKQLKQQQSHKPSQQDGKQKPSSSDKQQANKQDQQKNAGKKNKPDQQAQNQPQDAKQNAQQQQDQQQDQSQQQGQQQDQKNTQPANADKQQAAQQAKQSQQPADKDQQNKPQAAINNQQQKQEKERQQATQQWLRRIPDDPGGLLRRKFQYEYQRQRQRDQANGTNRYGQQAW